MIPHPLHQVAVITRLTFREARRRRLLWIGLGLGGAFIALFAVGFHFAYQDFISYTNQFGRSELAVQQFTAGFLLAGLYVVNFLVVMVTVLTSVGTISTEIATSTIHTLAAKPLRRWEIVLGKWLGHAAMLALYTLLLAAGVLLATYLIGDYFPSHAISALLILVLESLAILSVTLLGSAVLPTLANGVVVFMLYGVAFVGGWVEQIGTLMGSRTAVDLGIASSLLMPSEALWRYVAGLLQPVSSLGASITPFSVVSQPTPAFLIYSVGYTVALLGLTIWAFARRDF